MAESVIKLEAMGFPHDLAEQALASANGDVEHAAALLLDPSSNRKPNNLIHAHHARNPASTNSTHVPSEYRSTPRHPEHNPPPRPDHHSQPSLIILRPDHHRSESQSNQIIRPPALLPSDSHNSNNVYPSAPVLPSRSDSGNQSRGAMSTTSGSSNEGSRSGRHQPVLRPGEIVRDQPMPQALCAVSASNDPSTWPTPRGPEYLREGLQVRMFVDVRDTLGKWLEAEVIAFSEASPLVHYSGWDSKWDEVVHEPQRIASCHRYSSKAPCDFEKGEKVFIWLRKPSAKLGWIQGMVKKIDGQQLQVEYTVGDKKYQYWYHAHTDEIRHTQREGSTQAPVHSDLTNGTYFEGQFLEVRDNVRWTWRAAEVRRLKPETNEILIHYDGLAASWDEYLHVENDAARIKPLGADIPDTPEIAMAKREDEEFREGLKAKGMSVVDVERDGNCLYRSVAHQIYNDVNKHAEVRKACCDYMQQDQEFFSCFIPEDFESYVKRQQKLNEWGDHPEVVALRELFNVNVEVYDKSNFPNPLYVTNDEGVNCVMRLTFHGQNHYNSLVKADTTLPLLPLAQSSKVNLKQLRQSQMKHIDATSPSHDAKEPPTLERQNTIFFKFGLGRAPRPLPVDREPRFEDLIDQAKLVLRKYDRKGYILKKDCITVVRDNLTLLKEAKQQYFRKQGQRVEYDSVNQEYENSMHNASAITEMLIQNAMANDLLVHILGFERNLMQCLDQYWGHSRLS